MTKRIIALVLLLLANNSIFSGQDNSVQDKKKHNSHNSLVTIFSKSATYLKNNTFTRLLRNFVATNIRFGSCAGTFLGCCTLVNERFSGNSECKKALVFIAGSFAAFCISEFLKVDYCFYKTDRRTSQANHQEDSDKGSES
jgi:hypothetical protein